MAKRKRKTRGRQVRPQRRHNTSQHINSQALTAHVIRSMREGISLRKASLEHGISPRTVLRHAGSILRKNASGKYRPRGSDKLLRVLVMPTSQGLAEIATRDSRSASLIAEYSNAAQLYLQTGDDSRLRAFDGKHVVDAAGNRVSLLTDRDELERLGSAGVLSFESLYAKAS